MKKRIITLISKKLIVHVAKAYELKPDKNYLIQIPELEMDAVVYLNAELNKRGIYGALVVMADTMQIIEADKPDAKADTA